MTGREADVGAHAVLVPWQIINRIYVKIEVADLKFD